MVRITCGRDASLFTVIGDFVANELGFENDTAQVQLTSLEAK